MNRAFWWKFCIGILGASVMGCSLFLGVEASEAYGGTPGIITIAHRAGARFAPENTVAALEQAIRDDSAMAEIDVQQLRDGTLIVMHDSNFLRTAGVDKNVWDVDYPEMSRYDVGTGFSDTYAGEGIPTLEQMLTCARGRITLMIELKSTGREKDLEKSVLHLLQRYDMEKECVIGSMTPDILRKVKKLDREIPTVLIAHSLQEDQYELEYADSYSIEANNLSMEMVDKIHAQDKPIYGWTVNSWTAMQGVLDSGADGIVSDNIYQVKAFLRSREYGKYLTMK